MGEEGEEEEEQTSDCANHSRDIFLQTKDTYFLELVCN